MYTATTPIELSDYALGTENCLIVHIRKIERISWRWVGAYKKGLSGPMATQKF
jgi:hypothetical protein